MKSKIKKGDQVKVMTGSDKGKIGVVLKMFPKDNKALVEGVNLVTKHTKPSKDTEGGLIKKSLPIHTSNLAYFDSNSNSHSKVGFKLDSGLKVRVLKKTGVTISNNGAK